MIPYPINKPLDLTFDFDKIINEECNKNHSESLNFGQTILTFLKKKFPSLYFYQVYISF